MASSRTHVQLGQILVDRGLLSAAELEEGLARQVIHGGRIGSNLVELGSVSIEAVADALSIQLGVPAADLQRLEIGAEALAVIPPKLCEKYKILPLRLDPGALHLAMQDPGRQDLISHLANALRVRIQPYVTPQLRLLYLLERYHGVERPRRYVRDASEGALDKRRAYLKPTVGPSPIRGGAAADPVPDRSRPSSGEAQPPSADTLAAAVLDDQAQEAVDTGTSQYELVYLDDASHKARPQTDLELIIDVSLDAQAKSPAPRVEATTLEALIGQLLRAQKGDEVVTRVVQPVLPDTTLSVLLLPRSELAVALAATGTALTAEQVRSLVVPLDVPSMIKTAFTEGRAVAGDASGDRLQVMMAAYLKAPPPVAACVVPISVGPSVANLLCVQFAAALNPRATELLGTLGQAASTAYTRIIGQRRGTS